VILYELLTGYRPFRGEIVQVLSQLLTTEPDPPSRYRPGLDARLEAICLKAMAKRAEDRYATMAEFAEALAECTQTAKDGSTPSESEVPLAPAPPIPSGAVGTASPELLRSDAGSQNAAVSAASVIRSTSAASGKIRFVCPNCSKALSVSAEHAGKQGRCSGCGQKITVPTPTGVDG
jgi:hypothetical protein